MQVGLPSSLHPPSTYASSNAARSLPAARGWGSDASEAARAVRPQAEACAPGCCTVRLSSSSNASPSLASSSSAPDLCTLHPATCATTWELPPSPTICCCNPCRIYSRHFLSAPRVAVINQAATYLIMPLSAFTMCLSCISLTCVSTTEAHNLPVCQWKHAFLMSISAPVSSKASNSAGGRAVSATATAELSSKSMPLPSALKNGQTPP